MLLSLSYKDDLVKEDFIINFESITIRVSLLK